MTAASLDLPWTPLYTQSGGFNPSGGLSAGPPSKGGEDYGPLFYWSLAATVAFTLFVYTFEGSLDARQKRAYERTEFPQQLKATVAKIDTEGYKRKKKAPATDGDGKVKSEDDDEKKIDDDKPLLEQLQAKFTSSQTYGLDKINFGMFASTYDTFESVVFLVVGFMPYMWDQSIVVGQTYFGWTVEDEIKNSLIFLLLVTLVGTVTSLPFELYSTFQIEKRHGFNKQTLGLFFSDKLKSLALTCLIGGPFVAFLLKIIKVSSLFGDRIVMSMVGRHAPVLLLSREHSHSPIHDWGL